MGAYEDKACNAVRRKADQESVGRSFCAPQQALLKQVECWETPHDARCQIVEIHSSRRGHVA